MTTYNLLQRQTHGKEIKIIIDNWLRLQNALYLRHTHLSLNWRSVL